MSELTPPCDIAAEAVTLGSIILDAAGCAKVSGDLRPGDFFRPAHQAIFESVRTLYESGGPVDLVTLRQAMERAGRLEEIGGVGYLIALAEGVPDPGNVGYYAAAVIECARKRRLLLLGADLQRRACDKTQTSRVLVETTQAQLGDMGLGAEQDPLVSLGDAAEETVETARAAAKGGKGEGIPMGLQHLDAATGGMRPGEVWLLGARTSAGKTAFAGSVAVNVANAGYSVLLVSGEMTRRSMAARFLAHQAQIDSRRVRDGQLQDVDWDVLGGWVTRFKQLPFFLYDRSASVAEIGTAARRAAGAMRRKIDLLIVDYVQIMQAAREGVHENRAQQVAGMSQGVKNLAEALRCPCLLLSQFDRASVKDGKPPTLHAFKDSGDLENDASVALLLWRPPAGTVDGFGFTEVYACIAKNRDGPCTPWPEHGGMPGAISLRLQLSQTRFEDGRVW